MATKRAELKIAKGTDREGFHLFLYKVNMSYAQ